MIYVAIIGFGNVGQYAYDAVMAAPDMSVTCICTPRKARVPEPLQHLWTPDLNTIREFGPVDTAILCCPSRLVPETAEALLALGVCTVDSFDIHSDIPTVRRQLDEAAKRYQKTAVLSAGWDPGSDSVIRTLMEAMAPRGLTHTNFGPGMSMGHTVAVKALPGVADALSVTVPLGEGLHRRMVYVLLEEGHTLASVTQAVKKDPYFSHDETHVFAVSDVEALRDMGHGVHMVRRGGSGKTQNQAFSFSMTIDNPALTAALMVACARAGLKRDPGCYTMIEFPLIDLLPGQPEELVARLV